ncbi:MarR family winged helix-turn-helix transcriptional regulator [Mycobacteroides chelonae]|uniref:MarR family winged helix-turn-helix transcriptional regulator n=1 Tax=Mycobacteroides chelonae TaxID=1774 RepID=UPI003AB07AB6
MARIDHPSPEWLNTQQLEAWRMIAALLTHLPFALDGQLRRDADLSFLEYSTMAMLSDQPDRTMRLSDLAVVTNSSLSRLSHLMRRMESRDLIRRETDSSDGRYTNAILTKRGVKKLEDCAPAHVEYVRSLLIEALGDREFLQLGRFAHQILEQIGVPY